MEYVIIGNSAAAVGAIEGIRSVDRGGKITVVSDEPYHTYSRPLISYYLAGKVRDENMYYRPADFYQTNQVTAMLNIRTIGLDLEKKAVELADGRIISYDKLLLATGGKSFVPPMEGMGKGKVFSFLKWDDVKAVEEVAMESKRAVIVGAGLIGLKAAEALVQRGVKVTVVELADRILSSILDSEAALLVLDFLEERGIEFKLGNTVQSILGEDEVIGVKLKTGENLPCDFLVVAIGVVPNVELVKDTAVEVNRGIVVNERLQTNVTDVYAAGDVAEGYDVVYGEKRLLPILPNAYKQGETAGINMAGGERLFPGGFAMNSIGFFGMAMNTAGIVNPTAEDFQSMITIDPEKRTYKRLVFKDQRLVGFIILNTIDRSGILTGLISDAVDLSGRQEQLLQQVGLIPLPADLRHARQSGGAA